MPNNNFVFYGSWANTLEGMAKEFGDAYAKEAAYALIFMATKGVSTTESPFILSWVKNDCMPNIEAAQVRYEKAQADGLKGGRPRSVNRDAVLELKQQGLSNQEVATALGCHRNTVASIVATENVDAQQCTKTNAQCTKTNAQQCTMHNNLDIEMDRETEREKEEERESVGFPSPSAFGARSALSPLEGLFATTPKIPAPKTSAEAKALLDEVIQTDWADLRQQWGVNNDVLYQLKNKLPATITELKNIEARDGEIAEAHRKDQSWNYLFDALEKRNIAYDAETLKQGYEIDQDTAATAWEPEDILYLMDKKPEIRTATELVGTLKQWRMAELRKAAFGASATDN